MAGGEWRLGTASIYMGASYRSPPLRQAKFTQLHGYNSRPTKQIRQRYRPLNRAERGKLRLRSTPKAYAPFKFASRRFALLRSAPKRSAPKRSTSRKFASRRSAP